MSEKENCSFEVGYIESKDLGPFAPLIIEDVRVRMEKGEPMVALGLSTDNTAVGAVCGKAVDPYTFSIESLYVAPDYRRMGGATGLLESLFALMPQSITSVVVDYVADNKEKKTLDAFLEYGGAEKNDMPMGLYRIGLNELKASNFVKNGVASAAARPFSALSADELKKLKIFANENVLPRPEEGFTGEGIFTKNSICFFDGDEIGGYLVADDSLGGYFTISEVYFGDDTDVLMELLCAFVKSMESNSHNLIIYVPATDHSFASMLCAILPEADNIERHYVFERL